MTSNEQPCSNSYPICPCSSNLSQASAIFFAITITLSPCETDKEKRKFIEGNIAGLRLSRILIPLKETVGVKCDDV